MTEDAIPRNSDGFIDWPALNGDEFVDVLLEHHQLAEFVDLYRRNGFPDEDIHNMIWAKAKGRWHPTWATVEGIADDQRKATDV